MNERILAGEWSADELLRRLDAHEDFVLLDVRTAEEFAEWAIPAAINISSDELAARMGELPRDRQIVTICAKGLRSRGATELLAAAGFDVTSVDGGMAAWARVYDSVVVTTSNATVVQVRRRGKGCLGYVVGAAGHCLVIDPSVDIARFTDIADDLGWHIDGVTDTHLHADHLSGARLLASERGAALLLSDDEAFHFAHESLPQMITLGDATISVLPSPGHTMGSTMFLIDGEVLLSGDTVFTSSVGRPDLADRATEFAGYLYGSIHQALDPLDEEVLVLPAHFSADDEVKGGVVVGKTVGALRTTLDALSLSESDFVTWAAGQVGTRPPNYVSIVEANQGADPLALLAMGDLEIGPNRCAVSTH